MAEVGASVALQMIHDLGRHVKDQSEVMGVADEVMSLLSMLSWIRSLLMQSYTNELVVRNEETIRDLAYKIEDVLETCFVDVAVMVKKNEPEQSRKRCLGKFFPALNYGSVLKNIKVMISRLGPEIDEFRGIFPIGAADDTRDEPLEASRGQQRFRQTHPRGDKKHFVGMDDEMEKLVSLVVDQKTRVISIWGVTGLGKTTIARKIYNHPQVRKKFEAFAWACLNEGCEINSLLLKILRQLGTRKVSEAAQQETMRDQLMQVQRQKNCLIVLDNIQDKDHWTQLSLAFPEDCGCGVILLTTREGNVASVGFPHELRLLDEYEGWDLLKQHAFPGNNGPDVGMFPTLGKGMVQNVDTFHQQSQNLEEF